MSHSNATLVSPVIPVTLQSWTNVFRHFCISGAFSDSHRPNPSPHPTNKVGSANVFRVSTLYRVGGGEVGWRENSKKISKRMHRFMREPRNDSKK